MISLKRRPKRHHSGHHEHELNCLSLCCAKSGQSVCVTGVCGEDDQACRLRELGLREGARVTVVRHGDPLIVRVDDVRLGLGRVAANNVLCEFLDTSHEIEKPHLHAA